MPSITIKNIKNYACKGVNLEIKNSELMVILGPNGSGKTTLLNAIAGLIDYDGSISFDSKSIDRIPPHKRGTGYLFQNLVLFPHLDVYNNIAYSLSIKNWPVEKIRQRVNELLKLVNIQPLASRYPSNLSGGEKQRVAMARALAPSPNTLLLDEPMSSLDAQTAKYLRIELKQIQRKLGITTIYVTHDLLEAIDLADRMAIMLDGNIEQVDEPERLLFSPASEKVSDFIGAPNILDCDYSKGLDNGTMEVGCKDMKLIVPHENETIQKIAILPQHIYVSDTRPKGPGINGFTAVITGITHRSGTVRINLDVKGTKLAAEIPFHIFEEMNLNTGKEVYIILRMRKIRAFENRVII
jgi:ABC-type Fe3+/spermidine/putrescine transport system ATPase subunit